MFAFLIPLLLAVPPQRAAIESHLATRVAIEGVQGPSLEQRMRELHAPAVSYAVVEDGKIVLAEAVGDTTTRTLFQAASISKPVFAIGVMRLVEDGKLSLDTPVNSILHSWKLPDNALTASTPVTLRMLLSHSGGTTVHGFPGYAVDETRPTVVAVLNGAPPANTQPIVVDSTPNTKYNYSGGGVTIAQLAIMDLTGMPFPVFMHRTVLEPLGMTSSTYEEPLPPSRRSEAATAHKTSGNAVPGKWHIYPEMAAAGLWTTPSDLARVIIAMQNALAGHGRVLKTDTARLMLTPRFPAGPNQWIGLGFFIEKHGDAMYFSHGGSNEGFRSLLIGSEDGHHGLAIMVNSDNGGALMNELARTIAREYKWPGFEATTLHIEPLSDAGAGRLAGRYRLPSGEVIAVRRVTNGFEILDLTNGWTPLYSVGAETLARSDRNIRYAIRSDGVAVIDGDKTTVAERRPDDDSPTGRELLASGRIDQAIAAYRRQFNADPKSLPESELNNQGYNFMFNNRLPEAATIMRLNTEFYPQSANAWDSLAEVLVAAGDIAGARAATDEELRRIDADPHASADLKKGLRANAEARQKQMRQ